MIVVAGCDGGARGQDEMKTIAGGDECLLLLMLYSVLLLFLRLNRREEGMFHLRHCIHLPSIVSNN